MQLWVPAGTIWFVQWVISLCLVWRMVDRKDLNRVLWIVLTLFFGFIILIIVALLPHSHHEDPPEMMS